MLCKHLSFTKFTSYITNKTLSKTILEVIGGKAGDKVRSAAQDIIRNLSKSKQMFDTDKSDTALYKNVPKYEGGIQASGICISFFLN